MRINTNIAAMNAQRNLGITNSALAKTIERLASGFRINRAGDDAAGLSISEKLRAQIRGTNQAIRNAQDGVSMIQTSEGALSEVHSMLQRMRELLVQAANDTYNPDDRFGIQIEIEQLVAAIDRVARDTQFNNIPLLDGSLRGKTLEPVPDDNLIAANGISGVAISELNKIVPDAEYVLTWDRDDTSTTIGTMTLTLGDESQVIENVSVPPAGTQVPLSFDLFGVTVTTNSNLANGDLSGSIQFATVNPEPKLGSDLTAASGIEKVEAADLSQIVPDAVYRLTWDGVSKMTLDLDLPDGQIGIDPPPQVIDVTIPGPGDKAVLDFDEFGIAVTINENLAAGPITDGDDNSMVFESVTEPFNLQIGPNSGETLAIEINSVRAIDLKFVNDEGDVLIDASTSDGASEGLDLVDEAIDMVSAQRAELGAQQNTLEHVMASLGIAAENLSASESRIRDLDVAAETVTFTKLQILQQAGTAVLAQANVTPQTVLQLLR